MVDAVENELWQVYEGDVVQARRVEPSNVLLVPQEQNSRDGTLELGDRCDGLRDGTVEMWIRISVRLCIKLRE